MNISPIALFAYNRPEHLRKTIEALQNNLLAAQSDLYLYCDGCKSEKEALNIQKVRDYAKQISGFHSLHVIEREKNYGLAKSIISGVTEMIQTHGKVIVLEDDLMTSKYFLKFMNDALNFYESEERVGSISGYLYPLKENLTKNFFLRGADCWGWATWKRSWKIFEPDGEKLLKRIKEAGLEKKFNMNNKYNYLKMLSDQIKGRNDSWAIRWHASSFLANKLCLYPYFSLIRNIGLDGSGTHCNLVDNFKSEISTVSIPITSIPIDEDPKAKKLFEDYFNNIRLNYFKTLLLRIQKFINSAYFSRLNQ